jgi:hypothetical protein
LSEIVAWTTPYLIAVRDLREAGEALELKRTREGMLLLANAQRQISDCMAFMLKERTR